MLARSTDLVLALLGGVFLSLMINFNSLLAKETSPVFASWIAHGVGAVVALILVVAFCSKGRFKGGMTDAANARGPMWSYLGGVPGAITVILPGITVNSSLSLAGTIALMLVGQVVFSIASDCFGLFGSYTRSLNSSDFLTAAVVLAGSACIIFGRA